MLRLAVTPGEPAGIGPELVVRYCQQTLPPCELVVVSSAQLLQQSAAQLGLPLDLQPYDPRMPRASGSGRTDVPCPATDPGKRETAQSVRFPG